MGARLLIGFLAWLASAWGQAAPVDTKAALDQLRSFARDYQSSLQDFRCIKAVSRSAARRGHEKRWKRVDSSEEEIYYTDHRETRKLLTVNGKPESWTNRLRYGYVIGGEFGLLGNIFSRKAKAQVEFDHLESQENRPICVFRYRIAETDAPLVVRLKTSRIDLAHHGTIYSECGSGAVVRLDTASDPEPDKGIAMSTSIRFAKTAIGDKQFQLPQTAEDISRFDQQLTKAIVTFRNYRKYDASTEITF